MTCQLLCKNTNLRLHEATPTSLPDSSSSRLHAPSTPNIHFRFSSGKRMHVPATQAGSEEGASLFPRHGAPQHALGNHPDRAVVHLGKGCGHLSVHWQQRLLPALNAALHCRPPISLHPSPHVVGMQFGGCNLGGAIWGVQFGGCNLGAGEELHLHLQGTGGRRDEFMCVGAGLGGEGGWGVSGRVWAGALTRRDVPTQSC